MSPGAARRAHTDGDWGAPGDPSPSGRTPSLSPPPSDGHWDLDNDDDVVQEIALMEARCHRIATLGPATSARRSRRSFKTPPTSVRSSEAAEAGGSPAFQRIQLRPTQPRSLAIPVPWPSPAFGSSTVVDDNKGHRVLTTVGIICLCYFAVCGGAVGTELSVATGGPLFGVLGVVLFPVLVNFPITVVIAELCTAFPEDGGFAMWSYNAFGPFWGFLQGYWAWIASIFDRILYVEYLFAYACDVAGVEVTSKTSIYFSKVLIAIVFTVPGLLGSRNLSCLLLMLMLLVSTCFLVFTLWAFTKFEGFHHLAQVRVANITVPKDYDQAGGEVTLQGPWAIDWVLYLNTLFWNFDGYYLVSLFGGEVRDPEQAYPRGFFISFAIMWLTYVLPMVAAVCGHGPHWSVWEDDAYVEIATALGGPSLHAFVVAGAVLGIMGMYMTELYCEAYQLSGMAECGLLPAMFYRREDHYGTPRNSIAFSLVIVLVGLAFSFDNVMAMKNAFAAAVELVLMAAVIKLRVALPHVPRPTKIPGGVLTLCGALALPTVVLVLMIVNAFRDPQPAVLFLVITAIGCVLGVIQRCRVEQPRVR